MPRWVDVVRSDSPPSDDSPTSVVRLDDVPTALVPVTPPPAPPPSWVRRIAPWAVFGVVAVLLVGATTAWSVAVRGPEKPLLASVPSTYAAVPPTTASPTAAEPTTRPEEERAEVSRTRAARPATPRPRPQEPATVAAVPETTATPVPSAVSTPPPTTATAVPTTSRRPQLLCPPGMSRPVGGDGPCRSTATPTGSVSPDRVSADRAGSD